MKKFIYILTIAFLAIVQSSNAQNIGDLDGIYYQAVAIDDSPQQIVGVDVEGKPLYNREIGVRFTITKGFDGDVQWEEVHTPTTDKYGLFTVTIGKGDVSSSAYARLLDIPWIDADQFLKVEISTKNDGDYKLVSNQKFMSVPYAFYCDDIADDAITTAKILNEEILAEDINTGAVETSEILDETILAEDIATGSVETSEILDETILAEDIATGSVETSEILNETILAEDIATGAVATAEILNETILSEDIRDSSIVSIDIQNETIQAADIDTSAVTTSEILDETILAEDIATGSVETSEILNETILAEDIAAGAVTTDEILDATIVNADVADATIDLTTKVTNLLPVENGGTGLDASVVTDGQVLIGDGTVGNFKLANLTAGAGIEITHTAGGITITSPPISSQTSSDGTFQVNPGASGVINGSTAWTTPNSLKVTAPVDKPFAMGDIFLVSADSDLKGCILSAYLESIGGDGRANVQVVIFNPAPGSVTLASTMTLKFLIVK